MTGFRIAYGGAQQHVGVTPDVTTMGKVRIPPRVPPTAKPILRRHTPTRAPRRAAGVPQTRIGRAALFPCHCHARPRPRRG